MLYPICGNQNLVFNITKQKTMHFLFFFFFFLKKKISISPKEFISRVFCDVITATKAFSANFSYKCIHQQGKHWWKYAIKKKKKKTHHYLHLGPLYYCSFGCLLKTDLRKTKSLKPPWKFSNKHILKTLKAKITITFSQIQLIKQFSQACL